MDHLTIIRMKMLPFPGVLLLVSTLLLPGCGKKDTPTPTDRTLELRISAAGVQDDSFGQTMPTAYVQVRGEDLQHKDTGLYAEYIKAGEITQLLPQLPVNDHLSLSIVLKKAELLMQPGTRLKAGIYFHHTLLQELTLDYNNYKQPAPVNGDVYREVYFLLP